MVHQRLKITYVRISGYGGQGIVLAGRLLADALASEFEHVASSASYGPESRGSACRADVVYSESFIPYPRAEYPDFFAALSQAGYDKFIDLLKPGATALFDEELVKPLMKRGVDHIAVPAGKIARDLFGSRRNQNLVMLGALARSIGAIKLDTVKAACRKAGFKEGPRAVRAGWEAI